MKPWVQSLVPCSEVVKTEDMKHKVILGWIVSSKPAWDIYYPVSKKIFFSKKRGVCVWWGWI